MNALLRLAAVVSAALLAGPAIAQPGGSPLDAFALVIAGVYDGGDIQSAASKRVTITAKGNGVFEYTAESGGMTGKLQFVYETPSTCVFISTLVAPAGKGLPVRFDLNKWSGLTITPVTSSQALPGLNAYTVAWTGPEDAYQTALEPDKWQYMGYNVAGYATTASPEQVQKALYQLKVFCPMS